MTRHHSNVMKRRAALAAILALASFTTCLAALWLGERASRDVSRPQARAAQLVEPYLGQLGDATSASDRQSIVESIVHKSGEVVAAVVVRPDFTIEAAYPGRTDLVGKSVKSKADEDANVSGGAAPSGNDEQATTPPESGLNPPANVRPDPSEPAKAQRDGKSELTTGKGAWMLARSPQRGWESSGGPPERLIADRVQGLMEDAPSIGTSAPLIAPIQERLLTSKGELAGWLLALPRWPGDRRNFLEAAAPIFGLGAFFSFVLYSLMLPWWVYLDARPRTTKAVPLALFVFLTNFLGWLTYLVIRPESDRLCPSCDSPLDPGYRLCPMCGWSGASRCHQCGRPARPDWRFCPYCEAARPDVELANLARPGDVGKGWG
jgi:hypothetical protein